MSLTSFHDSESGRISSVHVLSDAEPWIGDRSFAILTVARAMAATSRVNGNGSLFEVINYKWPKWPAAMSNRATSDWAVADVGLIRMETNKLIRPTMG